MHNVSKDPKPSVGLSIVLSEKALTALLNVILGLGVMHQQLPSPSFKVPEIPKTVAPVQADQ